MTICKLCGRDDGHHHDHDEFFICARCFPIIEPLIECRLPMLLKLVEMPKQQFIETPPETKVYPEIID